MTSTIEQAQGVLMACYGYDPGAALAVLRRVCSSRNLELADLAAAVVGAAVIGGAGRQIGPATGPALSPCDQVGLVLGDIADHRP